MSGTTFQTWQEAAKTKRDQRDSLIPKEYLLDDKSLPPLDQLQVVDFPSRSGKLSQLEIEITEEDDVSVILGKISKGVWKATQVLEAFIKRTCIAHQLVNPLTEIHFEEAREQAKSLDEYFERTGKTFGPLHGLPISLKDQFSFKGEDTTIGYVSYIGRKAPKDAVLVDLIKKAGGVPFVRTNLPQTLMHGESFNEIFGTTLNPHNRLLTPGGSSGGEGALVAIKGSPIGIGTDVGGSIRMPAAFCGLFGLKPSYNRLPYEGAVNSMEGQESVPSTLGPLTRTLSGLVEFTKAILGQKPWLYDPLVPEIEWNESKYQEVKNRKLTIGIMWDDGIARPYPPYVRALKEAKEALTASGHEVIDFKPYKHAEGFAILGAIFAADGGEDIKRAIEPLQEPLGPSVSGIGKDAISVYEYWQLSKRKVAYRKEYLDHWNRTSESTSHGRPIDAILCPGSIYTAQPLGSEIYVSYTGQWNLLDYSVGVLPVTQVDPKLDPKPETLPEPLSEIDEKFYKKYDPTAIVGAPVGLQVVGRRYQEEAVLGMTSVVHEAIQEHRRRT
ncbi:amidase [Violaceomyces palustris]|uniref:Amidase n=1 Tax=Violaceomyces palustris TaxID=1673888 RepID=A0ACD0P2K0_9BASI|nr:amidase [Violaceomyces palustris]